MPKKLTNIKPGCSVYSHDQPFELVSGKVLSQLDLAFETYGELNSQKDNVIVLHHSLSMSAHAANLDDDTHTDNGFDYNHKSNAGWWDNMIGPGKALDTDKYFIICINNLGSCFGSTGPGSYAEEFPVITIHDIAISQKLLLDYLRIPKIKLIIGSSMGGMISLAWLQLFPESFDNLFLAACAHKAYAINIFNRMIQQEIIQLSDNKEQGLKVARMLGFYNYRSNDELNTRFDNGENNLDISKLNFITNPAYLHGELYSYFSHNADKFVNNFDVKSYTCMLNAMDLFDVTVAKSYHAAGYTKPKDSINIIVTGIDSDILFPLWQQQEIHNLLQASGYNPQFIEHKSSYGHDAFLIDYQDFGGYISKLLSAQKNTNGHEITY